MATITITEGGATAVVTNEDGYTSDDVYDLLTAVRRIIGATAHPHIQDVLQEALSGAQLALEQFDAALAAEAALEQAEQDAAPRRIAVRRAAEAEPEWEGYVPPGSVYEQDEATALHQDYAGVQTETGHRLAQLQAQAAMRQGLLNVQPDPARLAQLRAREEQQYAERRAQGQAEIDQLLEANGLGKADDEINRLAARLGIHPQALADAMATDDEPVPAPARRPSAGKTRGATRPRARVARGKTGAGRPATPEPAPEPQEELVFVANKRRAAGEPSGWWVPESEAAQYS